MVKSISENELNSLWRDFGKNMNLVAIMTVLTLVTGITGIIAIIFLFMALGNIKMINYKFNSQYLDDFRAKYIRSFILKLILIPFLVAGILLSFLPIVFIFPESEIIMTHNWMGILIGLVIFFILFIVSYSIEMKAWENLKLFLEQNQSMFPGYISREAIDGVEKLRTGALLYALGITAIIGFILQVIGFFKLAKFETIYKPMYPTKPIIPQAPIPPQASVAPISPKVQSQSSLNVLENRVVGVRLRFCPNCGAELKDEGKYCPDCGSSIS